MLLYICKLLSQYFSIFSNISGKKGKQWCYQFMKFKGKSSKSMSEQAEVNFKILKNWFQFISIDSFELKKLVASIPSTHSDGIGYFHSFAVTKNFLIFLEQPLRISFRHALSAVLRNKSISSAMLVNRRVFIKLCIVLKAKI
jgi:hypothetical protein